MVAFYRQTLCLTFFIGTDCQQCGSMCQDGGVRDDIISVLFILDYKSVEHVSRAVAKLRIEKGKGIEARIF